MAAAQRAAMLQKAGLPPIKNYFDSIFSIACRNS